MSESKSCCGSQKQQDPVITPSAENASCCAVKAKAPELKKSFFNAFKDTAKKYASVIGVFGLATAGAVGLTMGTDAGPMGFMHYAMGLTFMNFALLKMGNIGAFADSFGKYDLLAGKSKAYGLGYPFIEAGIGAAYLGYSALNFDAQSALYAFTLALTALGTAGVAQALKNGQGDLKCACVGGDKDLPLSKVALAENVSMGAMAATMLAMQIL